LLKKFNIYSKEEFIGFVKQVFRYGFVSVINVLISLMIYYFILWIDEDLYILAYTVCFLVSVLISYILQNLFVFKKTEKGHAKPLLKAYISYGTVFLLGTAAIYIMVEHFGISRQTAPLYNFFITIPLNFLLTKFWTFK
jgi:putative flippase GtrA